MILEGREWIEEKHRQVLDRGTHQSMVFHVSFLREEFTLVVGEEQWVVLPYLVAKELLELMLSQPGVKLERYRRPR